MGPALRQKMTMPPARLLLVFVEEPRPGRVMPRLAESVGEQNAARIYHAARHSKSYISLDGADHLLSNKTDSVYTGEMIAATIHLRRNSNRVGLRGKRSADRWRQATR